MFTDSESIRTFLSKLELPICSPFLSNCKKSVAVFDASSMSASSSNSLAEKPLTVCSSVLVLVFVFSSVYTVSEIV